ncbi:MAG: DNA polymerase III subunit delta [Pseudomonadota bacterium]
MQITTEHLRKHLKAGMQSVYFVYGDEPLQIRDNTDMLRKAAHYYGYQEREVYTADKSFDWQQLHQAASEISLFSSKKLIEIYLPTGKPGDKGSKALIKYCQNIIDDNILLIYTGELESSAKRSKWFKQLQSVGVIVAVYPLKEQQLRNWLTIRLQQNGLLCDTDALNFLAEFVEGNLLAADQEIIKLALLYKADKSTAEPVQTTVNRNSTITTLSVKQILAAVNDNSRYKGFDLFDTALKGASSQLLTMIKTFEQDGTAIVWLLFIISKEIRMLATITAYQQQMQLSLAMKKVYIFAQRKQLIEQVLRHSDKIDWNDYLLRLAEVDKQIKGVSNGNPWMALSTILLEISKHIH